MFVTFFVIALIIIEIIIFFSYYNYVVKKFQLYGCDNTMPQSSAVIHEIIFISEGEKDIEIV